MEALLDPSHSIHQTSPTQLTRPLPLNSPDPPIQLTRPLPFNSPDPSHSTHQTPPTQLTRPLPLNSPDPHSTHQTPPTQLTRPLPLNSPDPSHSTHQTPTQLTRPLPPNSPDPSHSTHQTLLPNSLMFPVVDRQDHPVGVISTADWDLVDKDVVSLQDMVEALPRLIDPVKAVLVHINGDHLQYTHRQDTSNSRNCPPVINPIAHSSPSTGKAHLR